MKKTTIPHKRLGCPGCRFADKRALYRGACCTFPGKLEIDDSTGKCKTRRVEVRIGPHGYFRAEGGD